jgi:hypothetical protein
MRAWQQAVAFGLLAAGLPVLAADHREAPGISQQPTADLNDIYVFRDPDDPDTLILVMTVNPLSDPDFAGSYIFSPQVLYRFAIDNTGDAVFEHNIDIVFNGPTAPGVQRFRARLPEVGVVPGDVTPPSAPDDPVIVNGPPGSGVSIFAGPRDDPFFFDGVGFSRFVATGDPAQFRGIDSFADFNVSAIVVALPIELVSDGSDQLEISGFTFSRRGKTFQPDGPALDRTGNPAVSTALIPFSDRNRFNRTEPQNDLDVWGGTILNRLNSLGTSQQNIDILASVAVPDTMKFDSGQPDGFPNGRRLEDDVIDTLFSLIFNGGPPTGDGVDANDRQFLNEFPFLAPPFQAAPAS